MLYLGDSELQVERAKSVQLRQQSMLDDPEVGYLPTGVV